LGIVIWEATLVAVKGPPATKPHGPVTCGDYIVSRLDKSFAYRNKDSNK
jgi:hypothetical protein